MNILIAFLIVGSLVWGAVATLLPNIHPIVAIVLAVLIGIGAGYVTFRVEQVMIRYRKARDAANAARIAAQIDRVATRHGRKGAK